MATRSNPTSRTNVAVWPDGAVPNTQTDIEGALRSGDAASRSDSPVAAECERTPFLLGYLQQQAETGTLRRLGIAFATFLHRLSPMSPAAIIGCVLVSELEGKGHSCLMLCDLVDDPAMLFGVSDDEWYAIRQQCGTLPSTVAQWRVVLSTCTHIWTAGIQDDIAKDKNTSDDDEKDHHRPLALEHDRLYLRRFWRNEKSIAQAIALRTATDRPVDLDKVAFWLNRLFPATDKPGPDWQKMACAIAVRRSFTIITGGPGTGKTYTVARLLALLLALADAPQRLRVAMAAPSGKAAVRLTQSIDQALQKMRTQVGDELDLAALTARLPAAKTLHSLLGFSPDSRALRFHADKPLDVDVLIVDEASMVNLEMMAHILQALPARAMLVLLGDKDQLSSVEAGAVLGDLCMDAQRGYYDASTEAYLQHAANSVLPDSMLGDGAALSQQTVMLRVSERFGGAIGSLATAVNAGEVAPFHTCFSHPSDDKIRWIKEARIKDLLALAVEGRGPDAHGYQHFLSLVKIGPPTASAKAHATWVTEVLNAFESSRILCAVRAGDWGVTAINAIVEERLQTEKLIQRHGEWYAGRPVMVTRNDYNVGVRNGDVGIALPDASPQRTLRVYFSSGEKIMMVLPTRLAHVETAYAMTVHKVQGSEFAHTVLVLPETSGPIVTRELIYTAITRASTYFTLVTPAAKVADEGIRRQTVRASGLRKFIEKKGSPV